VAKLHSPADEQLPRKTQISIGLCPVALEKQRPESVLYVDPRDDRELGTVLCDVESHLLILETQRANTLELQNCVEVGSQLWCGTTAGPGLAKNESVYPYIPGILV